MKPIEKQGASLGDYAELFNSQIGQKVLFDLMRCHNILSSTFVPGDQYTSAFNEGERSVVLRIMRRSKTNMKRFLKQLEEMQKQNETDGEI